jgi:hypothetical protein
MVGRGGGEIPSSFRVGCSDSDEKFPSLPSWQNVTVDDSAIIKRRENALRMAAVADGEDVPIQFIVRGALLLFLLGGSIVTCVRVTVLSVSVDTYVI